jgi:hypothetical protein
MLAWFIVRPSSWQAYVRTVAPDLAPTFCLAHLRSAHWKDPDLRRAVVAACAVAPSTGAICAVGVLLVASDLHPLTLIGVLFGVGIGLTLSATVTLPAGAWVSIVGAVAFGLAFARPNPVLLDFIFTPRLGLVYGAISLVAIYVTGNVARRSAVYSSPRQIGGVVVGLLAGAGLIALIVAATTSALDSGVQTRDGSTGVQVFTTLIPALCLGLAAYLRSSRLATSTLIAAVTFVALVSGYGTAGREFGRDPETAALLTSVLTSFIAIFLVLFALPFAIVERIAGPWAGIIAGALGGLGAHWGYGRIFDLYAVDENLLAAAVLIALGVTAQWWRQIVFYPFEAAIAAVLLQLDARRRAPRLLRWHPAFWDEGQWLPLYGLDQHVLLACDSQPDAARGWIDAVGQTPQRWAAQAAQVELDARRLEACRTLEQIVAQAAIPAGSAMDAPLGDNEAEGVLRALGKVSADVRSALAQTSAYNRQLVLRMVGEDLGTLAGALARSNARHARRFQPIVRAWHDVVGAELADLEREAMARREIPDPYIVGAPLTRHQQVFVGRIDVSRRIEALLGNPDQPPLLLYGQRRMGKTSLLFNLPWMLPSAILPLTVDLQGPVAQSADHASFLYNLAKGIATSALDQGLALTRLSREALAGDPFTAFDDWLDGVEAALDAHGHSMAVLALDEFEALDSALSSGRLEERAVLGMLRHIAQYRPRFKLILAGSHLLSEFSRWATYLINAQTVHLGVLDRAEATRLIEQPIKEFPLSYANPARQHVLTLTRGHPYLVQLLCSEVVALKNEQPPESRFIASVEDVECASPLALMRGRQFFVEIEANQLTPPALLLLRHIAKTDEGRSAPPDEMKAILPDDRARDAALQLLLRRELIESRLDPQFGGYAFQIELVRRWFAHG